MVLPTHPSRHWQADRMSGTRGTSGDPIYEHRHPMDICTMMDQYCNISLHHFIMAGITKDGKLVTFSGPRETSNPMVLQRYIDLDGYNNWYNTGSMIPTPSPSTYEEGYFGHGDQGRHQMSSTYGGRRQYDRRRIQAGFDYDEDPAYRTRKRQRGTPGRRDVNAETGPVVQVSHAKRGIKIGNKDDVWKFYEQRFKNMQQFACKIIAKAWIKLIAPKKQSNHPYTGADARAPDWWPTPWGTTREEKVRHKEPDHLYKTERVYLLNHILRMITEPNRGQHRDIQKLNINVSKLEEATFEALSSWFGDVESPNNAKKRPYLKEIFRVAKYEERYKNGEIDADAEVLVSADDKVPEEWLEDEEEEQHDDDDNQPTPILSPKPEHAVPVTAGAEQTPAANLQGNSSFSMGDLPVRGHPYSQPSIMQSDLNAAGASSFVEGSSLGVNNQPSMSQAHGMSLPETFPDPHASNRRPSLYTSPTEYGSTSGSGLYQTWQHSNPPNASPVYSFHQQQQPHPAGSYVEQQPVPLTQTPQYLEAPTFDPMHNGAPPSLFRPTSVPQGPVNPHTTHSFPNYLSPHGPGLKMDPLRPGHPHDETDSTKRWA